MSFIDIGVSVGAFALVLFVLPIVWNKNAQVPRWKSSIPTAAVLTYFVPLFLMEGLTVSAIAIALEAVTWWLVVIFRPIKKNATVTVGQTANGTIIAQGPLAFIDQKSCLNCSYVHLSPVDKCGPYYERAATPEEICHCDNCEAGRKA